MQDNKLFHPHMQYKTIVNDKNQSGPQDEGYTRSIFRTGHSYTAPKLLPSGVKCVTPKAFTQRADIEFTCGLGITNLTKSIRSLERGMTLECLSDVEI